MTANALATKDAKLKVVKLYERALADYLSTLPSLFPCRTNLCICSADALGALSVLCHG